MGLDKIQQSNFLGNLAKSYTPGVYADTYQNRKLGRVGMRYTQTPEEKKEANAKAVAIVKIKDAIHEQTQELTGKRFSDESWEGVKQVREVIDSICKSSKLKGLSFEVYPKAGGYVTNGASKAKKYEINIYQGKGDNEKVILSGALYCHAAGTVEDPFSKYDMSIMIDAPDMDDTQLEKVRKQIKSENEKVNKLVEKSTLKDKSEESLDKIIAYSNSDGIDGIKVSENATAEDKKRAIAEFYMEAAEGTVEGLDSIIEDALYYE